MNFFSRFLPKVLLETDTPFNENVKVIDYYNCRKLLVNGVVQTANHESKFAKENIWGKLVEEVTKWGKEFKSILILGLAGGTMHHYLSGIYPNANVTTIEIDEKLIEISKKYFAIDNKKNLKIINEDAFIFAKNNEERFDLIICDIYVGNEFPVNEVNEFYTNLKKALEPNGIFMINRIIKKREVETLERVTKELSNVFPNIKHKIIKCPAIADNYIFISENN